jgi:hypothetical protein
MKADGLFGVLWGPQRDLRRHVRQRWWSPGPSRRQRYRRMERLLTTMPSFNSSPRMRLLPPEGILMRDSADERFQFGAKAGSTEPGSRLRAPDVRLEVEK